MAFNEKKKEDMAKAFSWWCDGSHNRPHQSRWLQTILSELDEKMKVMLSIIEEDGDSFAKRAEMYYKRRPQLVQLLEDLHKSYRSLAEKYDQIRSHDHHPHHHHFTTTALPRMINGINPRMSSFPAPFRSLRQIQNSETKLTLPETTLITSESSTCIDRHDHEVRYFNDLNSISDHHIGGVFEVDSELGTEQLVWSDKEVSEVIEDHLKQQAELIRRNEEKREKINELRCQIKMIMNENEALRKVIDNVSTTKRNQSKSSSSTFLGKLTGCTG